MMTSLFRALSTLFLTVCLGFATGAFAKSTDQCKPLKAESECNKKKGCNWTGKACAKTKKEPAAAAKPAKKEKTAVKKDAAKKPEPAPKAEPVNNGEPEQSPNAAADEDF